MDTLSPIAFLLSVAPAVILSLSAMFHNRIDASLEAERIQFPEALIPTSVTQSSCP